MSVQRSARAFGLYLLLASTIPTAAYAKVDALWDDVLQRHVNGGLVDYVGLLAERESLDDYLKYLEQDDPDGWPREQALAFWINAYNATVVRAVLDAYPVTSVKQVRGFFDRIQHQIAGQSLTLNGIEQQVRALGDWRIHMALVCASSSCPRLRSNAYAPGDLERQLTEQTKEFLSDSGRGLRLDGEVRQRASYQNAAAAIHQPGKCQ